MKYALCNLFFVISIMISGLLISQCSFAGNHREGLHLQLPETLIDFNASDIEQSLVAPIDTNHAMILIKLTEDAAQKIHLLSQKAIGQPIVWIWNGRALSMFKLESALDKDLSVGEFTTDEALQFQNFYRSEAIGNKGN